jgi:hypothetical protein
MDNDIYALLGYDNYVPKKKNPLGSSEALHSRGSASAARINTMKIKQKARELKEMRSIPIINEKSRRIAEGLKRDRLDVVSTYETKREIQNVPVFEQPEPVRVAVNIMKCLEIVEQAPPEPDPKTMNIHQRTKYWKEQKEKKLEEQRKAKMDKELDGCTFKPTKVEIQDFEIVNRPNTVKTESKNVAKRCELQKNIEKEPVGSLATMLKGRDFGTDKPNGKKQEDEYKGLSPATAAVRIKPGFLSDLSNPKKK